jgi:hypothetical protein
MAPSADHFSTDGAKETHTWNPGIVDELAAPDILLQYSLHATRRGRADVKAFMTAFREAFLNLSFAGAADL